MGSTTAPNPEPMPAPAPRAHELAGVRAVAFDLDCTLIDILRVKERAAEAAAWAPPDAGLDVDPAKAARRIMEVAYEIGIDEHHVVDEFLRRRLGRADPRLVEVGRHAYERAEEENAVPYPRAHRTLLELVRRGYALALITDAPRARAVRRLQAARLAHFFSEFVTLEDTTTGKVGPRPYELACARLGVRPAEVLMVGDHPDRDVAVAKRHGLHTALALYGLDERHGTVRGESGADLELEWLDRLLDALPGPEAVENSIHA